MRKTQRGAHFIDKTYRGCSSLLSAAVIKTIAKSNLGRKVFAPSYASRSWSIIERGQRELKQELKLRHREILFTGLLPIGPASFFIKPKISCLAMVPPTVDWHACIN